MLDLGEVDRIFGECGFDDTDLRGDRSVDGNVQFGFAVRLLGERHYQWIARTVHSG